MSLQVAIKKRFSGFSLDVSLNTVGGVMAFSALPEAARA